MKIFSSRRRRWAIAAVVILILFVLRPGASRLKSRIAATMAAAVGRPVEIGSVHIRLLPRPGFELENVVIYDGPAFGSEPLLRAPEVTAVLRLSSLLRGRMEIARLDLTEPSLNLVHSDGGRWNLEALLERTARSPLAPTAKAKSEPRPAFPYIEVSSGRINFKFGQEKKPYALINADFSLWQDSENSWGVRLKAQPFRSDLSLSDTGLLRVNGTWQRAVSLRNTPLQFALEWDRPQLGQLTKFLTGADKGWRGAVLLDATLSGTPEELQVSSDASVRDFRRYDIVSGDPIRLAGHCDAQYSSLDHMLHRVSCRAPVGTGSMSLHGELGLPGSHSYDMVVTAEDLPASAVAALCQRATNKLPQDLAATGTVEGNFLMRSNAGASTGPLFDGRGEIAKLRLVSAENKADVSLTSVPFVITSRAASAGRHMKPLPAGPFVEFGPVTVPAVKPAPASVSGWINRTGYEISLTGETEIARALHAAHLLGVPALATAAEGTANVDLWIAGNWAGWSANNMSSSSSSPWLAMGTAKLHNVRVPIRGTNHPIEISSADFQFSPDEVKVSRLVMNAAHAVWTGSIELPRGCGTPSACLIHFNLSANAASLSDLHQWAQARQSERPWYSVLEPTEKAPPAFFASIRAAGRLTVNRLAVQHVVATRVSVNLSIDAGKLKVSELRGDLFGGTYSGECQADFTHKPPTYMGSGTLTQVSMGQLADSMNDAWIAGVANGKYQVTSSGMSAADFLASAEATIQFEIRDGILPHLSLANGSDPLKINRLEGRANLHEGVIEIKDAALDSPDGAFAVTGTASLSRKLDFQLRPFSGANSASAAASMISRGYAISGTLSQPQATPLSGPETQARLKP